MSKPRSNLVSTRLTDEERAAWDEAAGDRRTGVWVRDVVNAVLAETTTTPVRPHRSPALTAMREQARALNRVARALDELLAAGRVATESDLTRIEQAVVDARG